MQKRIACASLLPVNICEIDRINNSSIVGESAANNVMIALKILKLNMNHIQASAVTEILCCVDHRDGQGISARYLTDGETVRIWTAVGANREINDEAIDERIDKPSIMPSARSCAPTMSGKFSSPQFTAGALPPTKVQRGETTLHTIKRRLATFLEAP